MKIFIFLFLILIIVVGCSDGIVYLNSSSNGECIIECNEQMKKFKCITATTSYQEIIFNQNITTTCECVLLDCIRNLEREKDENNTD